MFCGRCCLVKLSSVLYAFLCSAAEVVLLPFCVLGLKLFSAYLCDLGEKLSCFLYIFLCFGVEAVFCISLCCGTGPVRSSAFFPKPLPIFPVLAVAKTWVCAGQQSKIGYPAGGRFPF